LLSLSNHKDYCLATLKIWGDCGNARLIPVSGKKNAGFGTVSKFSPNARRRRLSMSHMAALHIVHGGFVSATVAGD
jgi:hypothetical protein